MVISAIGRIAAKAAMKKISDASAKKARAANKENLKKTDFKAIAKAGLSDIKLAETTGRASEIFKKGNKIFSGVLPPAAGEPGKFRASVNSAVSKKINSFSEKQLGTLSKTNFGPLLSQKVKRKVQNALESFKKPSRQKGGGMATRGMGAALRGGGMALRGMGAAYKKK
jgi:Flp pilus assembly protein TadG